MLYCKNDIIDIASDRSEELLELGDKGILERVNKVIIFLRRKDVQDVIGKDHDSNKGDSFFKFFSIELLKITKATVGKEIIAINNRNPLSF